MFISESQRAGNTDHPGPSEASASHTAPSTSTFRTGKRPSSLEASGFPINKKTALDRFVFKTSAREKAELDEQVAKMVFATNSAFRIVDHPEFVKMIEMLRPGYTPPSRKEVGDKHLPQVYEKEVNKCADVLKGKTVCLGLDGWSNVHNEPIICATVTTDSGQVYLVDTVDTSGEPHTAEYLVNVATTSMEKARNNFGCQVGSIVTDNAANVAAMRRKLEEKDDTDLVTYGCSAHILNLLAHDLELPNVKEQVVDVVKYFRNNHFACAKYRQEGGNCLVMPQDVRWNTMSDCLDSYIKNWPTLFKICEENRDRIDSVVKTKVANLGLKRTAEELHARLSPIAVALDKMQCDTTMLAEAVEIWKELEGTILSLGIREVTRKFKSRYNQAITPAHLVANLIHPIQRGKSLTDDEKDAALEYASQKWPSIMSMIIKFQAQARPFQACKFTEEVTQAVSAAEWWESHDGIKEENRAVVKKLLSAVAASSGVERVFSSYGLVHSKLRNRLGTHKAAKLVFLFKALNMK